MRTIIVERHTASVISTCALIGLVTTQPPLAQKQTIQEQAVDTSAHRGFRAVNVTTAPTMDGVLDDPQWQEANLITDFRQLYPRAHTLTTEPTELSIVYTEDALYIAARMFGSNPQLISAPTIRHGQSLPCDDRVVVIPDPFNQGRAGYQFETNLNNAGHDSLYESTQYDNLSRKMGVITRLQWIPKAGQEGFIVSNYNIEDRDRDNTFNTACSDISVKFRYTFRFSRGFPA